MFEMITCPHCGNKINTTKCNFCAECGYTWKQIDYEASWKYLLHDIHNHKDIDLGSEARNEIHKLLITMVIKMMQESIIYKE